MRSTSGALTLSLALTLAGCGKLAWHKPADPAAAPEAGALAAQHERGLADYAALTIDQAGWPSPTDCDDTVFAGDASLGGAPVAMQLAEYAPGEIHRRPKAAGECYPNESKSTASRDDAVLYAAAAFDAGDRGALERLLDYAGAHGGYIGDPHDLGLTFLGPNLEGTIARGIVKLGGSRRPQADYPMAELPPVKDYQGHIETNEILFSAAVQGAATDWELRILRALAVTEPDDSLYQAAMGIFTGDCERATRLLLDPATPFPSYVRGDRPDMFQRAWRLRAEALVLSHCKGA